MPLDRGLFILVIISASLFSPSTTLARTANATSAEAQSAKLEIDAAQLVMNAVDQTRGLSSYAEMTMHIKRPKWQRTSSLIAWTRGREDSLIRFTAPARDAGNALLKNGNKMWTFNPKLNRSVRLPNSMMSQSWAGSDFSYNDLSRSDKWLRHYTVSLVETVSQDGHDIHTIDAVPLEDAPVVWGRERMVIRDDYVLLELTYFDQDQVAVKKMVATEVGELGGRMMATVMRMEDLESPGQFTEVRYDDMSFDVQLEDRLFTVFSLQSGRTR